MPRPKSFYHLNFSVVPGGARMDGHYIRATLEEIKRDLEEELARGINLYLLCWYGATLRLEASRAGQLVKAIGLHPFLEISIEGYPTVTFGEDRKPIGYDFRGPEERSAGDHSLSSKLFGGEVEDVTTVRVAWDRIEVPALDQDLVEEDDMVTLEGDWREGEELTRDDLFDEGWLPAGYTDLEE